MLNGFIHRNEIGYVSLEAITEATIQELSSHPGYFQEPHWFSMGLPKISRVTLTGVLSLSAAFKSNHAFDDQVSILQLSSMQPKGVFFREIYSIDDHWQNRAETRTGSYAPSKEMQWFDNDGEGSRGPSQYKDVILPV